MKTHRCRREEEKEEGVTIFEKMKVIYREGGRVKKRVGSHNYSQKMCKTRFLTLPHSKNV